MEEHPPRNERAEDGEARLVWDFMTLTGSVERPAELLRLACTGLPRLVPGDLVALARRSPGSEPDEECWVLARCAEGNEWTEAPAPRPLIPILVAAGKKGGAVGIEAGPGVPEPEAAGGDRAGSALESLRLRRLLLVPLVAAGDRYGVLLVGRDRGGAFSSREVEHACRAAEHLALRLARAASSSGENKHV